MGFSLRNVSCPRLLLVLLCQLLHSSQALVPSLLARSGFACTTLDVSLAGCLPPCTKGRPDAQAVFTPLIQHLLTFGPISRQTTLACTLLGLYFASLSYYTLKHLSNVVSRCSPKIIYASSSFHTMRQPKLPFYPLQYLAISAA